MFILIWNAKNYIKRIGFPSFMPIQLEESPIYTLPQRKSRAIIPKVFSSLLLSIIFYLGILVNLSLLKLSPDQESKIKLISFIVLLFINLLGLYLAFHQAKPYLFYGNRIKHNRKEIYYQNILNTAPHQDFSDKIFKTYSLNLGNYFHLRNISQEIQIQNYLQQLIAYAKN